MEEKIKVLDIEIDRLGAKASMQKMMEYMESEAVNAVEIVTMDMLLQGQELSEWKEAVRSLDLVLPGEPEILEVSDAGDRNLLYDVSNQVFLKMFLRYLQKNHKKVFLVAQSEEELLAMERAVREYNRRLLVAGHGILQPDGSGAENIINDINGAETDCIFSILPSPEQELFIYRNSALLNARIWFGCGSALNEIYLKKQNKGKIKRFFRKRIFRYLVGQKKKEEDGKQ